LLGGPLLTTGLRRRAGWPQAGPAMEAGGGGIASPARRRTVMIHLLPPGEPSKDSDDSRHLILITMNSQFCLQDEGKRPL